MLFHMRKKSSLRHGKGGVRFRLILKRLPRVRTFASHRHRILRASRNVASQIGHPSCPSPVRCRVKQNPNLEAVGLSVTSVLRLSEDSLLGGVVQ